MLADVVEHLVTGIVEHPEDVSVVERGTRRGPLVQVRVHPDDIGRVIGRAGRTASALRTVVNALSAELVVEVAYDHMEGSRFRHTAQFRHWRPDRDPASCTYAQLDRPVLFDLAEVLGA